MIDLIFAIWLLLLGAVGGSAMGAFAHRLQSGQSWFQGRSICAGCSQPIPLQDLVPVVSYLMLRGHCRQCRAPLPKQLFIVEITGIGCAALALIFADGPTAQISGTVFLLLLLGLFLCDLQTMRLPDVLTGALAIAGLGVGAQWHGVVMGLVAAIIGVAVFFGLAKGYAWLRDREGLGQGDIKMMAGLSAMAGPLGIPWVTLFAATAALVITAGQKTPANRTTALPLGCYLACAGAVVWLFKSTGLV